MGACLDTTVLATPALITRARAVFAAAIFGTVIRACLVLAPIASESRVGVLVAKAAPVNAVTLPGAVIDTHTSQTALATPPDVALAVLRGVIICPMRAAVTLRAVLAGPGRRARAV